MRKPFPVLIIPLILLFILAFFAPARAEEKEITVLVYICGTDLESESGEASGDIREMASSGIGNSDRATVLIATGGATEWQRYNISSRNVQYYRLEAGQPKLIQDAGRMNMGEANTLSSFLRFGIAAAPAKRYVLILWDHGGGPVHGVCYDENYQEDHLTLAELKAIPLAGIDSARIPTLREVLDAVDGRTPLLIELKSGFGNRRLCRALMDMLADYRGEYIVESFNPLIVGWFRRNAPQVVRGQLVCPMKEYRPSANGPAAFAMAGQIGRAHV